MRKSLKLVVAVIEAVRVDICEQWDPSIDVPKIGQDFDPTDYAQFESYTKNVAAFLDSCLAERKKTENASEQDTGTLHKFGKGMKKIALHIAPLVKFGIQLGKDNVNTC
jgi:hypothetical protein